MRLSNQAAGFAKRFQRLGRDDWMVRFYPSSCSRRKCPGLPGQLVCRLIAYQMPGFRASWLLTSLFNTQRYSRQELVDLYHRRWTLETIYREWKHSLDIQNLRSHTPAGILKEVHAQLTLSNLVRWIMTEAAQGTEHTPLDFSFLTTLTLVKNMVATMIETRSRHRNHLYQQLISDIQAAKIRKRPGRSYPRPGDGKLRNKGRGKYQLPSRLTKT